MNENQAMNTNGSPDSSGLDYEGDKRHRRATSSDEDMPSSTRMMRNIAEKMRRDKLNTHITELASIVPIVSMASKKVDKTSILRLSAAYLRMYHNLAKINVQVKDWKPALPTTDNLEALLLEAVNGFLIIVHSSGKIIYVSEEIEKVLGHSQVDLMGHSIYTILHPDDHMMLQKHFQEALNSRMSFYCRLLERKLSRADRGRYDLVHCLGLIRPLKKQQNNPEVDVEVQESLLISVVHLLRNQPILELSLMDSCHDEYITCHLLDGNIISVDHRISIITGHSPSEVCGRSAYEYIFPEDIPVASIAHRDIFTNPDGMAFTIYRLWTRDRKLIYLKTRGILQYNSTTQKADNFICVNKMLPAKEGETELHRFQMRFTPCVNHPKNCEGGCSISNAPRFPLTEMGFNANTTGINYELCQSGKPHYITVKRTGSKEAASDENTHIIEPAMLVDNVVERSLHNSSVHCLYSCTSCTLCQSRLSSPAQSSDVSSSGQAYSPCNHSPVNGSPLRTESKYTYSSTSSVHSFTANTHILSVSSRKPYASRKRRHSNSYNPSDLCTKHSVNGKDLKNKINSSDSSLPSVKKICNGEKAQMADVQPVKVKRGRGRPRKYPLPDEYVLANQSGQRQTPNLPSMSMK